MAEHAEPLQFSALVQSPTAGRTDSNATTPAIGTLETVNTLHQRAQHNGTDSVLLVLRKVGWRLLPVFFLLNCLNYLDRTNLAFASIQMSQDLQLTQPEYGAGAGLFFIGYAFFQIPSQIILRRVGAPIWLSVIVSIWGVVACCMAAIQGEESFYAVRLVLGVAESGSFPGYWFYLTKFYPDKHITLPYSITDSAIMIAQVRTQLHCTHHAPTFTTAGAHKRCGNSVKALFGTGRAAWQTYTKRRLALCSVWTGRLRTTCATRCRCLARRWQLACCIWMALQASVAGSGFSWQRECPLQLWAAACRSCCHAAPRRRGGCMPMRLTLYNERWTRAAGTKTSARQEVSRTCCALRLRTARCTCWALPSLRKT